MSTKLLALACVIVSSLLATGCATVKPWQRGLLADSCMVFDADTATAMTHCRGTRGLMGGFGVQGGGCGCK
jgi:hypothetical protein